MAQAHHAGFEARYRPRRLERIRIVHQRSEIGFACNPAGIAEPNQFDDATFLRLTCAPWIYLDARGLELPGEFAQRGLIGHFPADDCDVVSLARLDDKAVMVLVHPQEKSAAVRLARDLQAQQLRREAFPGARVLHAQPEVAQLHDARHRSFLLRRTLQYAVTALAHTMKVRLSITSSLF